MKVQTYITQKPVRVYVINGFEVEAEYLWDAVMLLRQEQQFMYEDGTGRGSDDVNYDIGDVLVQAGYAAEGLMSGRYIPSASFNEFYEALRESLNDRLPFDQEPTFVWALDADHTEAQPPADR